MAVRFDDYPIEELEPPVLVVHARDDRLAVFSSPAGSVEASLHRYPDLTTAIYDTGGHLLAGQDILPVVSGFMRRHA